MVGTWSCGLNLLLKLLRTSPPENHLCLFKLDTRGNLYRSTKFWIIDRDTTILSSNLAKTPLAVGTNLEKGRNVKEEDTLL